MGIFIIFIRITAMQANLKSTFIRGSVVRYIQIDPADVDTELLQDAARKENLKQAQIRYDYRCKCE